MVDTEVKNCVRCPSYVAANETLRVFGKSIGAPMCATYGKVLGNPTKSGAQNTALRDHIAERCSSYGDARPSYVPSQLQSQVILPEMSTRIDIRAERVSACSSCGQCQNYVPENYVASNLGWAAGLCLAWGKLIPANRQTAEARNCEYRQYGAVRDELPDVTLLPEFDDAFSLGTDPITMFKKAKERGLIEPHEYETDKPVTAEETESGIRAWRKIPDPEGSGSSAYLPIYNIAFFSDEEQKKIPKTGDPEHPELYVDHFGGVYACAVTWGELDETPSLWGEAGNGKTELGRHLAWLMCLPFERISITNSTELDDLAGKMLFDKEKGTHFQYGRVPLAWQKPCVIILDEPNVGQPDVWQFLRPLTDNSKQLVLDMNKGEPIQRHDDCYLMLAANPAWDVRNVGAQQIGDADASRLFHIFVPLPPEELEREIIKARVFLDGWELSDDQLNMVMAVAKDIRGLTEQNIIPVSWGIRPQIKVARALRWFSPLVAYRRAVGDHLEPEAQQALLDVVRAHIDD